TSTSPRTASSRSSATATRRSRARPSPRRGRQTSSPSARRRTSRCSPAAERSTAARRCTCANASPAGLPSRSPASSRPLSLRSRFTAMALLSIRNVTRRFGGIVAIDDVSLDVEQGRIVGLIGPNGAGKTTLFNVVTRLYRPDEGELDFAGRSLLRTPPHRVVRRGIARTFQNVELFRSMTVLDNVLVGAHTRTRPFRGNAASARALEMLDYVGLAGIAQRPVAALPFGTQKRVELARALVAEPRLLLLDEPAGGLNHEEVSALGDFIRRLRDDFDLTVLLVEHHMGLVMGTAERIHVLDFGRKIAEGTPEEIRRDPAVIEA